MGPLVSVIVPVYRVEPYLRRCLDSLAEQSLKEIEIILVDDGSPDRCGEICEEYAARDQRFRVIHRANGGLSAARNTGIEAARAEYLMFVDSDDYVLPDFCRHPYECATREGADLVMFRRRREGSKKQVKIHDPEGSLTEERALWLMSNGLGVAVWNKLYRRDLFKSIRFPVGRVYEDVATTHLFIHAAELIWYLDEVLYCYCPRPGSITSSPTEESMRDGYVSQSERAAQLREWGYTELAQEQLEKGCWTYMIRVGRKGRYYGEAERVILNREGSPTWFNTKQKLLLGIYHVSPLLFDVACILFGRRAV